MAEVINLNKARKRRAREEAERRAAGNRIAFGRTPAERQRDELAAEDARRRLEQLRLDSPSED